MADPKNFPKEEIMPFQRAEQLYNQEVLTIFLRGESSVLNFVGDGGMTSVLGYLAKNADAFGYQKLGNYKILYPVFNELKDTSEEAYLKLFWRQLTGEAAEAGSDLVAKIKAKIQDLIGQGYHVLIFLHRFDRLDFSTNFFNNLWSFWQIDKVKVHYIFAVNTDIFNENFAKYADLRSVLCQNQVFFPLFSFEEALWCAERFKNKYHYQTNLKQTSQAVLLSGGQPSLLRILLRKLSKNVSLTEIKKDPEIVLVSENIWASLSPKEKLDCEILAKGNLIKPDLISERLLSLGMIILDKSKPKLFSELFIYFLTARAQNNNRALSFDAKTNELLVDGRLLRQKLGLSEYRLVMNLIQNKNKIFSRDEIAEILWGEESFEKYSDWAIDKVLSGLRKKLAAEGIDKKKLQAVRNRGYRWFD